MFFFACSFNNSSFRFRCTKKNEFVHVDCGDSVGISSSIF
jgi:hypothetical protein